jgi:hypothetical protein
MCGFVRSDLACDQRRISPSCWGVQLIREAQSVTSKNGNYFMHELAWIPQICR